MSELSLLDCKTERRVQQVANSLVLGGRRGETEESFKRGSSSLLRGSEKQVELESVDTSSCLGRKWLFDASPDVDFSDHF